MHPVNGSHASLVQIFPSSQLLLVVVHPTLGSQRIVKHAKEAFVGAGQTTGVFTHPEIGLQVSVVHAFPSSQLIVLLTHPNALLHCPIVHLEVGVGQVTLDVVQVAVALLQDLVVQREGGAFAVPEIHLSV